MPETSLLLNKFCRIQAANPANGYGIKVTLKGGLYPGHLHCALWYNTDIKGSMNISTAWCAGELLGWPVPFCGVLLSLHM